MKRIIFNLLLILLAISCNEKGEKQSDNLQIADNLKVAPYNITDLGDGLKYDYDTLSVDYIKKVKTSLLNRQFKFPDEQKFKDKVLEVFNVNIYDYKNKNVVLRPAMFTEIAIKENKFILIEDPETDDNKEAINDNLEFYYNSYVFYGDKNALNWLKLNNREELKDLVIEYGYASDLELLKFVFEKFDFNNESSFEKLIFDHNKKLEIREDILDGILLVNYQGKSEDLSYAKEGNGFSKIGHIVDNINSNPNLYSNPEKTIAILLNKDLEVGVVGNTEAILIKNPDYKSYLKKNKYFNFQRLRDYVELLYGQNPNSEIENIYRINDPDGYTNLRKDKNSASDIVEKIKSGDRIEVLDNSGNWWFIQTKSGKKGYVYKTKIE